MVQQQSVLQKMEQAVGMVKTLQEEVQGINTRIEALDRQNKELKEMLGFAESKIDEVLVSNSVTGK
jgi:cell shape-determining protein MreC